MGRRILNRKDLRADYEAAERRKSEDEVDEAEDEVEEDDEEEEGDEEEAEEEEEAVADEEEAEEEAPPKKKKKAPAKPRTRTRTPKITRMKVIWAVFNNSNQRVATFDYPKRKEADDLAAKLTNDKKSTHFVQPIKEPMEEKKDE